MNTEPCSIERTHEAGLHVGVTQRGALQEMFAIAYPLPGEPPEEMFRRAAKAVRERGGVVVNHFVWQRAELRDLARETWESVLGETQWPVSWMVDEAACAPFGGSVMRAVTGVVVERLTLRDRIIGAAYQTESAQYLLLGGLYGDAYDGLAGTHAGQVFRDMADGLRMAGMDFSNVVRTWFFNNDILSWYDEFNHVRARFLQAQGMTGLHAPASTGIGAANGAGSALVGSLIAAKARNQDCVFRMVPSVGQGPATAYGSSFSRAAEIVTPDRRQLLISGTASIDPSGATIHLGDVVAQTKQTLDVVEGILESRDMTWADALEGAAYVRNAEDAEVVIQCLAQRGLADLPIIFTNCIVCRDDLLFELELQAAVPRMSAAGLPPEMPQENGLNHEPSGGVYNTHILRRRNHGLSGRLSGPPKRPPAGMHS